MNMGQQTVNFHRMDEGSAADYALLASCEDNYAAGLADRLLAALEDLQHSLGGFRIDRRRDESIRVDTDQAPVIEQWNSFWNRW